MHLDRARYAPVVIAANAVPALDRMRAAGIPVALFRDPVYSTASSAVVRSGTVRALALARRVAPMLALRAEAIAHATAVRALTRLLRAHGAALLHTNNHPVRDAYAIRAARAIGIPVVAHLRSVRTGAIPPALAAWLRNGITHAIANSAYARDWWVASGVVAADRVTVIPNPVACDPVALVDVRAAWGIPASAPVIGCIAHFTSGKGHAFLLDAFALLRHWIPNVALLLVGDGPLRAQIATRVQTIGIADAVRFVGYHERARAIIAGCDVLAVPSETETFGRVIVEAMGVGTPVVATRVGGIPEIVQDEVNGRLAAFGDAEAFATALARVLRDPELAARLRAGGRATVATGMFDPAVHATRVAAVYERVLARVPV